MPVIRGDAAHLPIRPKTVQAVVTSPPYLEQRTYGPSPLEGGHEGSLAGYVAWLADVLDQLRGPAGALRDDGLLWLNLGDKANGSGGAGGDWSKGQASRPGTQAGARRFFDRIYPLASFLDVPGAVVHELIARGWRLRLAIVWDQQAQAAESMRHTGRPRPAHEMIYLLAPTARRPRFFPSMLEETGSLWHFRPGGSGPAHLAPFPDELARRCILPSTLPGDLVLDVFMGSGTVPRVAEALGRRGVGVDLYAEALPVPGPDSRIMKPESRHVDAKELAAIGLKPALLYYACRRIVAGHDLDTIARDFKITTEQAAYIEQITRPEVPA